MATAISAAPLTPNDMATAISAAPAASPRPVSSRRVSLSSPSHATSGAGPGTGRFLPGTMLAGRYRIIGMLGAGGMGEVYRADDLTLDQPIAIKFLPEAYSQNEDLLERFKNEVKIARKVSHPNVCRVYDVGETDGLTFLTMEYVDGEDLAGSLRRFGRLPEDKALEIARQVCAGLAAAHAKGVLHRDLKPANVMINSSGQAVIMDFGLAGVADSIRGAEIRSGTPAYMSPEQLSGREVTTRSDIYALGVMLFEIFTGKRPGDQTTSAHGATHPSAVHTGFHAGPVLDPLTERVLRRCIDPDPEKRPPNVLAVAAALPGGDPLAAALAAGETPSPEMVAAAGEIEGMEPKRALGVLAVIFLLFGVSLWLGLRSSGVDRMGFEEPAVLAHQARETLAKLGYPSTDMDSGYNFWFDQDLINYVKSNDKPRPDWDKIFVQQPPMSQLWYRQSPNAMSPLWLRGDLLTPGQLQQDDPAMTDPGMVRIHVDMKGRLVSFLAIPPEREETPAQPKAPDWSVAFAAAGLDPTTLTPAEPQWHSLASSDTRAAWTGTWPGSGRPLRVEAAALHGKIVYFQLLGPWSKPARQPGGQDESWIGLGFLLLINVGSLILAIRNYRAGRADLPAALRLGTFMLLVAFAVWLLSSHMVLGYGITRQLQRVLSTGLRSAFGVMTLYLAVEPYVRRLWPQAIIGLTRLLSGRLRDAMVARDLLFGVALGLVWTLVGKAGDAIAVAEQGYSSGNIDMIRSVASALTSALNLIPGGVQAAFSFFGIMLLFRLLSSRVMRLPEKIVPWVQMVLFTALFVGLQSLGGERGWLFFAIRTSLYLVAAIAVTRFGLLTLISAVMVANGLLSVPITGNLRAWYAPDLLVGPALILALAVWAFFVSLGGRKLLPEPED